MADLPQFLTLADVAEVLKTSQAQVYALVRRKDLVAMKIGGRGQWRVSTDALEDYIKRMHTEASDYIDDHPFNDKDTEPENDPANEPG